MKLLTDIHFLYSFFFVEAAKVMNDQIKETGVFVNSILGRRLFFLNQ